jgi:hypothetical protein
MNVKNDIFEQIFRLNASTHNLFQFFYLFKPKPYRDSISRPIVSRYHLTTMPEHKKTISFILVRSSRKFLANVQYNFSDPFRQKFSAETGLPDFSGYNIPKLEIMPNGYKIYQMATK